jgi:hypothetical protein
LRPLLYKDFMSNSLQLYWITYSWQLNTAQKLINEEEVNLERRRVHRRERKRKMERKGNKD